MPCWLAAMTETPFRVTLDLWIGDPPAVSAVVPRMAEAGGKFHVQAEIFKQEWVRFRDAAQPWQIELPPERLFLLPD